MQCFFAPQKRGKKNTTPHFIEKIPLDSIKLNHGAYVLESILTFLY